MVCFEPAAHRDLGIENNKRSKQRHSSDMVGLINMQNIQKILLLKGKLLKTGNCHYILIYQNLSLVLC